MVFRETIVYLTKNIFPELPLQTGSLDKRVLSNLPLQMALYFNVIFAPVWIIVILLFLDKNYSSYDELYRYITITVICTIVFVEVLRLYLGYEGNLKDKIPELAGFWMLSILLQFPLQSFLLFNPYFDMYVLEIIVQSIMFSILCIELVSGYFALKYTATQQSQMYQNKQRISSDDAVKKTSDEIDIEE